MNRVIAQMATRKIYQLGMMLILNIIFLSQVYAQSDTERNMPHREGMMNEACSCPMMSGMMGGMGMHGAGGTIIAILGVILILALIAVLVATAVFLIRKSRSNS